MREADQLTEMYRVIGSGLTEEPLEIRPATLEERITALETVVAVLTNKVRNLEEANARIGSSTGIIDFNRY